MYSYMGSYGYYYDIGQKFRDALVLSESGCEAYSKFVLKTFSSIE